MGGGFFVAFTLRFRIMMGVGRNPHGFSITPEPYTIVFHAAYPQVTPAVGRLSAKILIFGLSNETLLSRL